MEDGKEIVKKSPAEAVQEEAMNILVSGVLHREDRTFVRVSFLRGRDWAEGILPDGVIEKAEGFTEEEIGKLEAYLAREKDMLLRQAKGINPIRNLFQLGQESR